MIRPFSKKDLAMRRAELLMMQEVWRRAFRAEGGLELTFKTKGGAVRARLQLYNAVAKQKRGTDTEDWELVQAANEIEIIWTGETSIRLRSRDQSDMIQGIQAALGEKIGEREVDEAAESLKRLMGEVGAEAGEAEHKDNPFYGKRG